MSPTAWSTCSEISEALEQQREVSDVCRGSGSCVCVDLILSHWCRCLKISPAGNKQDKNKEQSLPKTQAALGMLLTV